MYYDLHALSIAREQIDSKLYHTSLVMAARKAVKKPSVWPDIRAMQYIQLWLSFEVAAELQDHVDGESPTLMRRAAHAAYERFTKGIETPDQDRILNDANLDILTRVHRDYATRELLLDIYSCIETRILLMKECFNYYGQQYGGDFRYTGHDYELAFAAMSNKHKKIATVAHNQPAIVQKYHTVVPATPLTDKNGNQDMSRLGFDALHLQSKLANGQTATLDYIATEIFGEEQPDGTRIKTKMSELRAKRAAINMVTLKRAVAAPSRMLMDSITARYETPGTQLEAVMNMVVRGGVMSRAGDPEPDPA